MTITGIEAKARREALGLSQPALAIALGVSQPAVSAWETGTRRVPPGIPAELAALEGRLAQLTERMIAIVTTITEDTGESPPLVVHAGEGMLSGSVHDTTGPPLPAALQRVAAARAQHALRVAGIDVRLVGE